MVGLVGLFSRLIWWLLLVQQRLGQVCVSSLAQWASSAGSQLCLLMQGCG